MVEWQNPDDEGRGEAVATEDEDKPTATTIEVVNKDEPIVASTE